MSDEQEKTDAEGESGAEEATTDGPTAEEAAAAEKSLNDSDDLVNARWDFAVVPEESVSVHFEVSPKNSADAVTSVQVSFVEKKNHMVVHSFAGSSFNDLVNPKDGQGVAGDSGVDLTVFSNRGDGDLFAVLAGTVRHEGENQNFFFERQFEI